jgi:hypothetical protein
MNIYLNFTFILDKLDTLKDEGGNVKLIDFLQSLVLGICDSTGNFNDLDIIISPNQDDLVTIIDSVPLPNRDTILDTLGISTTKAIFDVYGYYNKNESNQNAGFIKDFQMKTEITPQMASMITIGSTSNGNIVGSDSTALSAMNKGIQDRYKISVNDPDTPIVEASKSLEERFKLPLDNFNKFVNTFSSRNYQNPPKWDLQIINAYSSTVKDFLTYDQAKISEKEGKGSPNIGFLPFNLSLKMEGLSGMKVYQKYTIDTSYLPSNYPNNLDFLIKSITHDISSNVWDTTIESIAVPNNIAGLGGLVNQNKNDRNQNSIPPNYFQGSIKSTLDETTNFLIDVLKGLNIQNPNQYQIQFMKAWRQHEGGTASWNPLNTTLKKINSKPYNSTNVQSYSDRQTGIRATIETLSISKYIDVIKSIKNIKNENDINKAMVSVNNSPWGSNFNPTNYNAWKTINNLIYKSPIIKRN